MERPDVKSLAQTQPEARVAVERTHGERVGLKVRSGLRAGQWSCTSCQGEVLGDQLFRPRCDFCQAT